MRHTSALKIIGFMRRNFGSPLSISAISRGVDLSYQPVHFHISELKKLEVVAVRRQGRESICRFVASEMASVWLALLTARIENRPPPASGDGGGRLGEYVANSWPKYECISCMGEEGQIIAVPSGSTDDELAAECENIFPEWDVQVLGREDFGDFLGTEEGLEWTRSASVISGHQRFWRYALTSGVASGLVVSAGGLFLSERG